MDFGGPELEKLERRIASESWDGTAINLGLQITNRTAWDGLAKTLEGSIGDYKVHLSFRRWRDEGGKSEWTRLRVGLPDDVPFTSIRRRRSKLRFRKRPPGPYQFDELNRYYKITPDIDAFVVSGGLRLVADLEDALGASVSIRKRTLKWETIGRSRGSRVETLMRSITAAVDRVRLGS